MYQTKIIVVLGIFVTGAFLRFLIVFIDLVLVFQREGLDENAEDVVGTLCKNLSCHAFFFQGILIFILSYEQQDLFGWYGNIRFWLSKFVE
mmetsp:Transcript_14456/g.30089  ORF Transcript_14456/g.30089 Transcript_14456/m.30089 type:complete len:91 (-) Transcript_14456:853-1125(-)